MAFNKFDHYEPEDWISYSYANYITSIDFSNNYIYFGTIGGGILRYNLWEEEWEYPLTTSTGLSSNNVKKIIYSRDSHELYAITDKGVNSYIESFGYFQFASLTNIHSTSPDTAGLFNTSYPPYSRPVIEQWPSLFAQDGYEFLLDGTIYNIDSEEYKVTDRLVDTWSRLWFGTNGTGIGKIDLNTQQVDFIKQSVTTTNVKDVFVRNDDIWFGGHGGYQYENRGITYWDYSYNQWSYYKAGINHNIASDEVNVIEGNKGYTFFGTEQGLLVFDNNFNEWRSLRNLFPIMHNRVTDLCLLQENLYVATTNGVFKYDIAGKYAVQISKEYISQTPVNSLAHSDSLIYIATNYGLYEYTPDLDYTKQIEIRAVLSANFINVVGINNNHLWIAADDGLAHFDILSGKWNSFPKQSLSHQSTVNDITFTKEFVWFATNKGLLRYEPENDYWYLYTENDGLISDEVNRIEVDGNYLWMATQSGVTLFNWNREGRKE